MDRDPLNPPPAPPQKTSTAGAGRHPTLAFVGIPHSVVPFPLFEFQVTNPIAPLPCALSSQSPPSPPPNLTSPALPCPTSPPCGLAPAQSELLAAVWTGKASLPPEQDRFAWLESHYDRKVAALDALARQGGGKAGQGS